MPFTVERKGYPEETWWTFSYSPICNEMGEVGGVLCIVHETTERVLTERRLRFLVDLGNRLRGLPDPREVMAAAAEALGRHLGAGRAGYGEVDAAGAVFTVERDWTDGSMPSFIGRHRLDDFGPPIIGALRAGRSIRLDDALADPRTAGEGSAAALAAIGMHAGISAPFMHGDRIVAALYAHQAEPRRWRDDETALMEEVVERSWEAVGRARAEAALRESEERFRQFAENTTDVLWIMDAKTNRVEYLSSAFERVWGEPRETMLWERDRWVETLHPDDRERALGTVDRVLAGEVVSAEYRIIRADGSVRRIRDTFVPIRGEDGRVRRVGGIAQDITQHEGSLVYLVDGDEDTRQPLVHVQGAGYEVKAFASVQAFLDAAPVLVPGCVLLDIRALGAGGLALLRELRARRIELPLIAMGGCYGDVAVAVQAMRAVAADYLEAPCAPEALLSAVASAEARSGSAAGATRTAACACPSPTAAAACPRVSTIVAVQVSGWGSSTPPRGSSAARFWPRAIRVRASRCCSRSHEGAHNSSPTSARSRTTP